MGAPQQRRVELKIQPGLIAVTDKSLLRVILENLIGDAWKFTRDEKDAVIEIGRNSTGEPIEFFVRDNGVGFDSQYAEKVFKPFQRLHSVSESEGTGIGLATVQRIITRLEGSIRVESAEGCGTTVYFSLPAPDPR